MIRSKTDDRIEERFVFQGEFSYCLVYEAVTRMSQKVVPERQHFLVEDKVKPQIFC